MSVERDKDWKAWVFTYETKKDQVFGFRLEDFLFEDSRTLAGHIDIIIGSLIEDLVNDN